ncbi:MAG: hypothetical protein ACTSPI_03575, partial [Candidatus Heimdallarchaeaceae archaeon]
MVKWIDPRCPRRECDGEIKDNGFGRFRCRKCDLEFLITHDPKCTHEWEKQRQCLHCGQRMGEKDNK